jgi:transposase
LLLSGSEYKREHKETIMDVHTVGIDLGKTIFHLVAMNDKGEVVARKKFSRKQLLHYTSNKKIYLIGMEACGGAHFLGRALREQGHEVRLIPAQYVKPYVKTNKTDYIDAEAIAEAVGRPTMRFVPIKSDDQLDLQSLHRVRERWVMRRTSLINQVRGLLLERGITVQKGRKYLEAVLPTILADDNGRLSGVVRLLLAQLKMELDQLNVRLEEVDLVIQNAARENEACKRLDQIPGIGPLAATALIAAIGNGAAFAKGREFAAWVGLVPREHTTGGKQKLLGISKRGNLYLRTLFIHGARALLQVKEKQSPGLSHWLTQLAARTHHNVAVVALANKLARIAWAVLVKSEAYRPPLLKVAA